MLHYCLYQRILEKINDDYYTDYYDLLDIKFLTGLPFENTNFGCSSTHYYLQVEGFYTTTWKRGIAGKAFAKFVEKKLDEDN